MNASDGVLYPLVGVGAFFGLFWTGFVLAWEAGLPCLAMPICGVLLGVAGAAIVARFEARGAARRSARVRTRSGRGARNRSTPASLSAYLR